MQRLTGLLLALILALLSPLASAAQPATPAPTNPDLLVYHQLTTLEDGTGGVGQPVLSGDGSTAVFMKPPAEGDAMPQNRIYIIGFDDPEEAEVDAYEPHCSCGAWMDISFDGSTVVSTDSMQLRLTSGAAGAVTLIDLTSNEMSSIRITADGDRVFFLLARDTQVVDSEVILQRGIYRVNADGSELAQIVGPDRIAELLGVTPDTVQMLRLQSNALDISADGSRVVFGAWVGAQQAVFAMEADGRDLHQLAGPVSAVQRVAISGGGELAAYDIIPVDGPDNEVNVIPFSGGQPALVATRTPSAFDQPLQLSDDGSRLLISPNAFLVDTSSGSIRQLAVLTPGADGHTALLTSEMPRATMDASAERFVYVIRSTRCADCPNEQEQLATLEIGAEVGDAPVISNVTIDPGEIPLNYTAAATVTAGIDTAGELQTAGMVALRDGVYDINVGRDAILHDDGTVGDVTANDGVYTNNAVVHVGAAARDDDTGARVLRIQAESESSDGRLHASAIDAGMLMVVEGT